VKRNGRHQEGQIFRKGNGWYLRYREPEYQPDGSVKRVQKCRKLANYGGALRTKSAVRVLADEFLAPLNNGTTTVDSSMSLTDFMEKRYLPFVKEHKAPSTYAGYRNLWSLYLKDRATLPLRDYRTCECDELLVEIACAHGTGKETIKRVKSFMSGTFRYAKRQGVLNTENPMWDTVIPECPEGEETYAYSLDEILRMLGLVPEPAATMVAVAGFGGLRSGELRGLEVEHYDGESIFVKQSAWRSHVKRVKTKASKAPVPVISQLATRLDAHLKTMGSPTSGFMFPNAVGKPIGIQRVVDDVIRPALKGSGIEWHGWHALRRGLASNLHHLGVPDKTIQMILRHANVAVTQSCYIKTVDSEAVEAMRKLECATSVQLAKAQRGGAPDVSLPRVQ
jgi:integrase